MDYGRRCDDLADDGPPLQEMRGRRSNRRLSQRLLAIVHSACDQGEWGAAQRLLLIAEDLMRRRGEFQGASGRHLLEQLLLAYERVWALRKSGEAVVPPSLNMDAFAILRDRLTELPDKT